jgi:hypothetical protein
VEGLGPKVRGFDPADEVVEQNRVVHDSPLFSPVAAERNEVKRESHYALPCRVSLSLTSKDARLSLKIYRSSASPQLSLMAVFRNLT